MNLRPKLLDLIVSFFLVGLCFLYLDPPVKPSQGSPHHTNPLLTTSVPPELDPMFTFFALSDTLQTSSASASWATSNMLLSSDIDVMKQKRLRLYPTANDAPVPLSENGAIRCTQGSSNISFFNRTTHQLQWVLVNTTQQSNDTGCGQRDEVPQPPSASPIPAGSNGTSPTNTSGNSTLPEDTTNITIPFVSPGEVAPNSSYPFASQTQYRLTLALDCAIGPTRALETLALAFGIPVNQLILHSFQCGSIELVFSCASASSVQDADSLCTQMTKAACEPGSTLSALASSECESRKNLEQQVLDKASIGSNSVLFALFALTPIPILLLVTVGMWLRHRHRQALQQRVQEIAYTDIALECIRDDGAADRSL